MKKFMVFLVAFIVVAGMLAAQTAPKKVMSPKEFEKFITDIPGIMQEVEAQGLPGPEEDEEMESDESFAAVPYQVMLRKAVDEIRKIPEWKGILTRRGWNERFWDYFYVTTLSLYVVAFEQYPAESMPPEIKTQLKGSRDTLHADDLALVRKNFERVSNAMAGAE